MDNNFRTQKIKKYTAIILILALIASLIPILYIAKFNHPYRDDYSNMVLTHKAFIETGSIVKVIKASFQRVKNIYISWQGSFSTIFLCSLNPYIFSSNAYSLNTYTLLFLFISSTLYFSYVLLVKLLKLAKTNWIIISTIVMLLSIQLLPSPVEGFYWYSGATHYTTFYSLSLYLFGLIINYLICTTPKSLFYGICCIPLSFFIGGGNYTTILNILMVLVFLMIYLIVSKNKKWKMIMLVFISATIAFVISASAPGNTVRQSHFTTNLTAIEAILQSFRVGLTYSFTLFNAPKGTLAIIIIFSIFVIPFLSKVITTKTYKFKYPIIVILLVFGMLCAQFTPTLYAMGYYGPERVVNIIFFSYIWYLIFVITYCLGWCYTKIAETIENTEKNFDYKNQILTASNKLIVPFITCIIILSSSTLFTMVYNKYADLPTSFSATRSIVTGVAYVYDLENKERLELLESDNANITLKPLSVFPEVLFISDYINESIAEYYDKESVIIE